MTDPNTHYLTSEQPGIGGIYKARPEDFVVEEQPLYVPKGEGEHCYLFIEKVGIDTPHMVKVLAEHFGVRERDIGTAGLKDAQAITRQLASIHTPGKSLDDFPMLEHDSMRVLWADMHTNKLRTGHLKSNRFSLRIREVDMTAAPRALQIVRTLAAHGVPNRYGPQRFGAKGNNALVGRDLLTGRSRRKFGAGRRRLFLSSLQSAVFNDVLDRRLAERSLLALKEGDLAWKHDSGSVFVVDREAMDEPGFAERVERFELSPSGPLWGAKMTWASGETDRIELEALAAYELTPEDFAESRQSKLVPGARRPLRVPIADPQVEGGIDEHGGYVRLAFDLPPGSYATSVLREVMKTEDL